MAKSRRTKSRGLGDTVEKVIKSTGLDKIIPEDCGCEKRKTKLNKLFGYRLKVINCPNDEVLEWYLNFKKVRTLTPSDSQKKKISEIYANIFNVPYYDLVSNSSNKPYIAMIDKLDEVMKKK